MKTHDPAAGPLPLQPASARLQEALSVVRRFPLRLHSRDESRDPAEVLDAGWFASVSESAALLAALTAGEEKSGGAFGGGWPWVDCGHHCLAPALPVPLTAQEAAGPDGFYRRDGDLVLREACGHEDVILSLGAETEPPGESFDLLWFGATERYLVRKRLLEVEDLFSLTRLAATSEVLDRLLTRGLRLDPAVLSRVPLASDPRLVDIAVGRSLAVMQPDAWRDPAKLIASHAGVRSVRESGTDLLIDTEGSEGAVLEVVESASGWTADLTDGEYLFVRLEAHREGDTVVYRATLTPRVDALTPGVRARIAFDLHSDLVVVGQNV